MYPLVIAGNPTDPNQFALGLTDGGVYIIEPLEAEGRWGTSPPNENGAGPSTTAGVAGPEQSQRWQVDVIVFRQSPQECKHFFLAVPVPGPTTMWFSRESCGI